MAHHHECECCSHEHHHEHHHEEESPKQKLLLIAATVVLLLAAVFVEHHFNLSTWQLLLVYLVPYLVIGHDTLKEAAEGLMSIATIGALCIGFLPGAETEFPEAVFVMLFFQVGELFEGYAEDKSRDSIAHLMDIRPDVAHLVIRNEKGETRNEDVNPETVSVGSMIIVRPGEKVPLDGVVIEGTSALNTVALTGESLPREITVDDEVISGCVNLSGVIKMRTTPVVSTSQESSRCAPRRVLVKALFRRLSIWWKTPASISRRARLSSRNLPASIHLSWSLQPSLLLSFPLCLMVISPLGSIAP